MHSARFATTPLPANLRLSRKDCLTPGPEGDHMKSIPYTPAISSLMYAMVATRPDIVHSVGVVSRFMHNLGRPHWNGVKHIFRYLVGTQDYDIKFGLNKPLGLVGTDSNYAAISTTGNRRSDSSSSSQVRRHFMEIETTGLYGYEYDRSGVHCCVGRSEGSSLARMTSSYVSTS
jgi:hypothetical protein